jgi:hypothetical protein
MYAWAPADGLNDDRRADDRPADDRPAALTSTFTRHADYEVGVFTREEKGASTARRQEARAAAKQAVAVAAPLKVGRCRLTVSKPMLKAPVVSALETIIT